MTAPCFRFHIILKQNGLHLKRAYKRYSMIQNIERISYTTSENHVF